MDHISIIVEGMSCLQCEDKIKDALLKLNGITSVMVNRELKRVLVEFDNEKMPVEVIKATVEDQGFEVK
jgi:Copper chaperone